MFDLSYVVAALYAVWKDTAVPRNRHYLLKKDLPPPSLSAWRTLYETKRDESFIDVMGFDVKTFHEIYDLIFDKKVQTMGRPHSLDNKSKLALTLHWLNSTMRQKTLAQLFGVTPTTVSETIQHVIDLINKKLINHPDCLIQWPSEDKMKELAALVHARAKELPDVFGFVDGLWLPIPNDRDEAKQNAYYNGWKSAPSISNVLCFSPEGKIIYAAYNMPGSWHDLTCANGLRKFLDTATPSPYRILGDKAFNTGNKELKKKLLTPMFEHELSPNLRDRQKEIRMHQLIVRERQAAEWGMRALQGTFARLTMRLSHDSKQRRKLLTSVFLLHNLHVARGGRNQIRAVYQNEIVYEQNWIEMRKLFAKFTENKLKRYYRIGHSH